MEWNTIRTEVVVAVVVVVVGKMNTKFLYIP